jgi:hypothetical protein
MGQLRIEAKGWQDYLAASLHNIDPNIHQVTTHSVQVSAHENKTKMPL